MKTLNIHLTAEAAVQVTRAASLFDRLADHLVQQLLARLEYRAEAGSASAPAELAALRERLDSFFPEFRQLYGGLLVKHLGAESARVIAALQGDCAQRYFRALQEMQPELVGGLERLGDRMALAAQLAARN
jgi:hypothetical protein